ncbi:MAG: lipopolysaccharide biosynthesis protein [Muribaculaceae bacterium]|nr:lipopolysaccharide biosynthesis protein [Muribaculaceae bacterium]
MGGDSELKRQTAKTLKWNAIDRVSSQVLYALTGIVLANILSKEDFGLVGALLVFQAFGILFVDSGFGSALLQKKQPTQRDYSTVFWFNLGVSLLVYAILWLGAPLIADIFQGDKRLIPMSRVMFLTFVLNGTALVQTTRLMKKMNVKMVAMANVVGLTLSGGIGIWLALTGAGAWALVWQSVTLSAVKSGWLWITGGWRPRRVFSIESLKSIWRVGLSVFSSSALNTFFLYIYSFVIGAFYNLTALGVYTQADKWSKMGSASISQVLTATFVPLLSRVQDDRESFNRYVKRINRFSAFIIFPVMLGGAALGTPLFHTLFGTKWDAAVPLFQILMARGALIVLISVYNNYLLALGYARKIFTVELVKDGLIALAVLATVWHGTVEALVWGQLTASAATWVIVLAIVCHSTGYSASKMGGDLLPFLIAGGVCAGGAWAVSLLDLPSVVTLIVGVIAGAGLYVGIATAFRLPELQEAADYLRVRIGKKRITT